MSAHFLRGRTSVRAATDDRSGRLLTRFGRTTRAGLAVAALTVAGLAAGQVATAAPASAAVGCTVDVVAHPDDDLFFLNPAIQNDIAARTCVHTVYVTSGDAGAGAKYARNREQGVQAAYAKMAGVRNVWASAPLKVGDQTITSSVLVFAPQVSVTFLRLPDGNPDGSGTQASGFTSLQQLYYGKVASLKTVDTPYQTYTTASLVKTLGTVMTTLRATTVRTLDNLGTYDDGDHSDHITVARLTSIARNTYAKSASLIGYLGYPGVGLPANVSGKELAAKQQAFLAYAPYDTSMCQTLAACDARGDGQWLTRQHLSTEAHAPRSVTPGNVASAAFVTQSSQNWVNGQQGIKAVDGKIAGFPGDSTAEWATDGGKAGSWLRLNWLEPLQVDTVVLYDRPNTVDWITGGTLTFSDGSTVTVPQLNNDGGPVVVTFPARTITSMLFTVTGVGPATTNVGLAELQVWTSGSAPAVPAAPTLPPPPVPTVPVPTVPAACGTPTEATVPAATTPATMPAASIDLGPAAVVTASSENAGQLAANVVDGKIDGYPGDWSAEWATAGCGAGAWLQLTWATPVTLDHVVLFDRPNANDQITSGTLTFSDGTSVPVGALANDGSATTVSFSARTTTSVRLAITGVSATTGNVGLAEFQAWSAVPAA